MASIDDLMATLVEGSDEALDAVEIVAVAGVLEAAVLVESG
jgi:hypothetical protein